MRVERESRSGGRGALGAYGQGLLNSSLVSNHRAAGGPDAAVFRADGRAVQFGHRRSPTPATPARPGYGRPPHAARRPDSELRARAVPAVRQPTTSATSQGATT